MKLSEWVLQSGVWHLFWDDAHTDIAATVRPALRPVGWTIYSPKGEPPFVRGGQALNVDVAKARALDALQHRYVVASLAAEAAK